MARIRTIKPDFFRNSKLYKAEIEEGLPLRVAFAGLWTAADREGRFPWRPEELKLDALPYDEVDFSRVLHALATRGYIVHYACGTDEYGCIPSWNKHQVVNHRESASNIPDVSAGHVITDAFPTRAPRVTEMPGGKGKEGKGKEGNNTAPATPSRSSPDALPPAPVDGLEKALKDAFDSQYRDEAGSPKYVWNGPKEGASLKRLATMIRNVSPQDPMGEAKRILEKYLELTSGQDKFWGAQPFLPSNLSAGEIFNRVRQLIRKAGPVDPGDDPMIRAARELDAKRREAAS